MRNGYKQTEVGVVPEDWEVSVLDPLVEITSGESPSKFTIADSGTPYFKVEQLNNDSKYATRTDYHILEQKAVPANSIVFPKRGASIFQNKIRIFASPSYMDTNLMALTCKDGLSPEYLFYQLSYVGLDEVADTTSVPQINNKHIKPFRIAHPKPDEQKAIAEALSDVDGLIAGLEALIAKKRDLKTATMQQLLTGKTRLPGFGKGVGMKQTELGELPEDWQIVRVSDILAEISMGPFGSDITVTNFVSEGVPVLSGDNIRTHRLQDGFKNYVSFEKAKALKKAVAKRGDIVLTHRGTIGQIAFIPEDAEFDKYVISQSQFRANFGAEVEPMWVALYFLSDVGSAHLLEGKGHTGVPAIAQATTTFRKLKLPLPTNEEQRAINRVISDFDNDIEVSVWKLSKAKALKQSMMQELLTGRTRLI